MSRRLGSATDCEDDGRNCPFYNELGSMLDERPSKLCDGSRVTIASPRSSRGHDPAPIIASASDDEANSD